MSTVNERIKYFFPLEIKYIVSINICIMGPEVFSQNYTKETGFCAI